MELVLIKVYAAFYPAEEACRAAVSNASRGALGAVDSPFVLLDADSGAAPADESGLLRISFEGLHFPLEEVLAALEAHLTPQATGKLDYLDLDNWTLSRYEWRDGAFVHGTRSLNHVLDYSGH